MVDFAKKKSNLALKLAEFLDLPLDTVIDWPRLVISGNRSVNIQNHHGVIEYDRSIVRINTKLGELKISGVELRLVAALREEIAVEGKILAVEWVDWR